MSSKLNTWAEKNRDPTFPPPMKSKSNPIFLNFLGIENARKIIFFQKGGVKRRTNSISLFIRLFYNFNSFFSFLLFYYFNFDLFSFFSCTILKNITFLVFFTIKDFEKFWLDFRGECKERGAELLSSPYIQFIRYK